MHKLMQGAIAAMLAAGIAPPALAAADGQETVDAELPASVSSSGSRVIYLAGQLNTNDLANKPLPADFLGQARAAFGRIQQTLKSSNSDLSDIVSLTVYVTDVRNIPSFAAIVKEMFPAGRYPASSVVAIKNLGIPGALIEIQSIAVTEHKQPR